MPENISGVPAGEKCFSLDIPFYRTSGPRRHAVVSTPTRDLNRTGRSSRMITCDMAILRQLYCSGSRLSALKPSL